MQVIPRSELRRLEAEAAKGQRLDAENAVLSAALRVAEATIATLEGEITGLVTLGDNRQARMAELKARLGSNSQNSSKPPSSFRIGSRADMSCHSSPRSRCSTGRASMRILCYR